MNAKKVKITLVSLLAVLWVGLSLIAWLAPAKEMSEAERRKLQQLPEISVESILSGKFMTDFETYTIEGKMKSRADTLMPGVVHAEFYPDEDSVMQTVLDVFYTKVK